MRGRKRTTLDSREKRHYAVLIGRDGPKIYSTMKEYKKAVHGFSGACSKRFRTEDQAIRWLNGKIRDFHAVIDTAPRALCDIAASHRAVIPPQACPVFEPPPSTAPPPLSPQLPSSPSPSSPLPPLPPPAETKPEISLSAEQRRVLDMVIRGGNVFFTGPAGTGKSVLLREILKVLRCKYSEEEIAVTASTGIAALNIGGRTVHSFGGINLGKAPLKKLIDDIRIKQDLRRRWRETAVLIIDEISMLDASIFDKLEAIARLVRRKEEPDETLWKDMDYYKVFPEDRPFGGIQLVLTGDFCQLPPVPDYSIGWNFPSRFAFDARSWGSCITSPVLLSHVFRQQDQVFVNLLSSIRVGELLPEHVSHIKALERPLVFDDGIEPSELYPLRDEVVACNKKQLDALTTPIFSYWAMDSAGWDPERKPVSPDVANMLLNRTQAPQCISLRIGAQVMLLRNFEQGSLVNGSLGKITEFLTIREANDRVLSIACDPGPGDGPSKRPSESTLQSALRPPPSFTRLTKHVFERDEKWPLVKFTNGKELLCTAMSFPSEGYLGNVEAMRIQVPLLLAWAMSIHKSQGQTLPRVRVDLGRAFEKGQIYVALSRATCMEGLEIRNFEPGKVQAHPRVLAWHSTWLPGTTEPADSLHQCFNEDEMDTEEAIAAYMYMDL